MLDVKQATKVFSAGTASEHHALNGLNLHLDDGEFVTIIGSNGAGKSTLFNAICGNYWLDQGQIFLDGQMRRRSFHRILEHAPDLARPAVLRQKSDMCEQ